MYNNNNNNNFRAPFSNAQNVYPQNRPMMNNNNNMPMVKKSGAVYSKIKNGNFEGMPIINAWRKTKMGLMTVKVAPYHASKDIVKSERNDFVKMIAEIKLPTGQIQIEPCLMNTTNKKIVLQKMGLVISPIGQGFTSSGKRVTGYFGKNYISR
jgi:hypothetical protein